MFDKAVHTGRNIKRLSLVVRAEVTHVVLSNLLIYCSQQFYSFEQVTHLMLSEVFVHVTHV